jgi:hypothetical protein
MSLASYSDLLGAIAAYTKRGDTAQYLPTWIALTEATFNRELRHYLGLVRSDVLITQEFNAAPTDFVALRSARLLDSPYWEVRSLNADQMTELRAEQRNGPIDSISVIGGQLVVNPVPGTTGSNIELLYYQSIPPLSATSPSNWVIANFPDLYLFGVMEQAADFYEDDNQLQKYSARFNDALTGTNKASRKGEIGFNMTPFPTRRAF